MNTKNNLGIVPIFEDGTLKMNLTKVSETVMPHEFRKSFLSMFRFLSTGDILINKILLPGSPSLSDLLFADAIISCIKDDFRGTKISKFAEIICNFLRETMRKNWPKKANQIPENY